MRAKSVVTDARQVQLAAEMVRLGARLQVLEAETSLSRERLLKLYKEVKGASPPKGMLPFSTDWFMSWMPNIHSSLFVDTYRFLTANTPTRGIEAVMTAYRLYLEHLHVHKLETVLSFTRAWSLARFLDAKMLETAECTECHGRYVVHAMDLHQHFVCGMCNVPSRAGKTKKAAEDLAALAECKAASRALTSDPVPAPRVPVRAAAQRRTAVTA
jgi:flagellar transcriptional activator FlhC